jgi:integrase
MASHKIAKGCSIYTRANSSNWYARVTLRDHPQVKRSLETDDFEEAKFKAVAMKMSLQDQVDKGHSLSRKTFAVVADEYIQKLKHEVHVGQRAEYQLTQYPATITKYFIPKLGKMLIGSVTPSQIDDYWTWRLNYWVSGDGSKDPNVSYRRTGMKKDIVRPVKRKAPSNSTLAKEGVLLSAIFQFAVRKGYVTHAPEFTAPKSKKRDVKQKPGFKLEEFLHLKSVSEQRVAAYKDDASNQRTYRDRLKLHCYVMLAGLSGLRPTELRNLNWGDVDERPVPLESGEVYIATTLHVRGKGKRREMVPQPEAVTYINTLRELFRLHFGRTPKPNEPVFINRSGERIRSFKVGLAKLLEAAGLRTNNGKLRDSGSFRHFYITQLLRNDVSSHLVGRNVDTATEMIDRHYSHVRATDEVLRLTPDIFGHRPSLGAVRKSNRQRRLRVG